MAEVHGGSALIITIGFPFSRYSLMTIASSTRTGGFGIECNMYAR